MSGHEPAAEQEVVPPEGAAPSPPAREGADPQPGTGPEQDSGVCEAADVEGDVEGETAPPDPVAEQRALAEKYLDLAQRTQADFDNYRKRMTREVRAAEARGIGRLAKELLPALDNLERALQAVEQSDPEHHLTEGIRLVTTELSVALGRAGIEGFDPTGEQFDPNQHEAVAQQPVRGQASRAPSCRCCSPATASTTRSCAPPG